MDSFNVLVGQKVVDFKIIGEDRVDLVFDSGRTASFVLDGDCCSVSYYTDPSQFKELVGTTILNVEERSNEPLNGPTDNGRDEYTRWYFLVFTTSAGHVTIDWRNDSNGYYDGSVVMILKE